MHALIGLERRRVILTAMALALVRHTVLAGTTPDAEQPTMFKMGDIPMARVAVDDGEVGRVHGSSVAGKMNAAIRLCGD
jgi:hypothetical protein